MKLTVKILIGLGLGALTGLILGILSPDLFATLDKFLFDPLGQIFISLISMLVVPIVLFSIILGTSGLGDPKKMGRIGVKTISYFLITTTVAIVIGIALAYIIKPGSVGEFDTYTL